MAASRSEWMVGISGQPSVLGFRRQKVGKAPDQAESTADTCGWRLLGTPCSSWSGRVQINQSAHPLNVQKLKVLRDSAICSDVLDSHTQSSTNTTMSHWLCWCDTASKGRAKCILWHILTDFLCTEPNWKGVSANRDKERKSLEGNQLCSCVQKCTEVYKTVQCKRSAQIVTFCLGKDHVS